MAVTGASHGTCVCRENKEVRMNYNMACKRFSLSIFALWVAICGFLLVFCASTARADEQGRIQWDTGLTSCVISGTFEGQSLKEALKPGSATLTRIAFAPGSALTGNASSLFSNCRALEAVSGSPDTSRVTDMSSMFEGRTKLDSVELAGYRTGQVTSFSKMFKNCVALQTVDLGTFTLDRAPSLASMFEGCTSLETVYNCNFNTQYVPSFEAMFKKCAALKNINLAAFNTSAATSLAYMFDGCSSLTSGVLGTLRTDSATTLAYMFRNCENLIEVNFSEANTEKLPKMTSFLYHCISLNKVVLGPHFVLPDGVSVPSSPATGVWCTRDAAGNQVKVGLSVASWQNAHLGSLNTYYGGYGWFQDSKGWSYLYPDGSYAGPGLVEIDGRWYYFKSSLRLQTGWVFENNAWYYFWPSGEAATGWSLIDGRHYYAAQTGAMAKGWIAYDGKWYWMGDDCAAVANIWLWIDDGWYYFGENEWRIENEWRWIDTAWYHLAADGKMSKGWLWDGAWYWLGDSGQMVHDTWLWIEDFCYYFYNSGQMAHDTWIDDCWVDSSGHWVK